jgi:hypothetical protein
VQAVKTSSKFFFSPFFISSDRARAADHENLLFGLSECFLPVEKYEIFVGCRFPKKNTSFSKCAKFFTPFFFSAFETNVFRFSIKNWAQVSCEMDSSLKTLLVVALRIVSTMMCIGQFRKPIWFFYVNDEVNYLISFHSLYHLSSNYTSFFPLLFFVEKIRFY